MRPAHRRRAALLAGFALYFAALWYLWPTAAVYPLKLFVVLLHEISHGLAALATGGRIERIVVEANEGGATYTLGGSRFLVLSAGYLGSLLWGLLLLGAARSRARGLRLTLAALGAFVLLVTALWVRNLFGFAFATVFGFALLLAARSLPAGAQAAVLTVLGLTTALYALLDIRSDIFQRPDAVSDARMLAELTGVPTLVWGGLWAALALIACGFVLRRELRRA